MEELGQLVYSWRRGQCSPLVNAYQSRPNMFVDAPKGTHPIHALYRSMLMEHHILGELWDNGKKDISPFLKLEVWHENVRHCTTPPPITKYIFAVTFKKIIPWPQRVVSLGDGSIVCKEQLLTPEDVYCIVNDNVNIHGATLQAFLREYRRRNS